jgi:hypothetical protein
MTLDQIIADAQATRAEAVARGATAVVADCDAVLADCAALNGGSAWPKWRQGLAVGVFAPIAGSSLSASFNDPNAINDWTGLAAGAGQWYAVCNGGHTDSDSNAAYVVDFTQDAAKWSLLRGKSAATADAPTGYYADGTPASRHTYNSPLVIGQRVMLFGAAAVYRNSYTLPNVDGFRLTDNQFDPAGTFAKVPSSLVSGLIAASWAKHPATEDVYGGTANQQWAKWTKATGTWSVLSALTNRVYGGYKAMIVDAKRNRIVMPGLLKLACIDLTSYAVTTLATTGLEAEAPMPNQPGMAHDFDLDLYYVGFSDGRIFKIDPTTGAASKIATLPAAVNGMQTRLAYIPAVKGVACYPAFAGPVYFLPTSA